MVKLGFIMAFNEVDWIGYAIDQATEICDRVIISEGSQFTSFPNIPARSNDGTLDIISDKTKEYPNFITVSPSSRASGNYRHNQCANFNRALSTCSIGDYFIPLDVDEYYSDSFLDEINTLTSLRIADHLTGQGHLYGFSFNWRIVFGDNPIWKKDILFKVVPSFKFTPTHKPKGQGKNKIISLENNIYHYTWVKPASRMKIRMQTSSFYPGMPKWFENNWNKIELIDGKPQQSHKGVTLTLNKYNGTHPSVLDSHPWRYINDIRWTTE